MRTSLILIAACLAASAGVAAETKSVSDVPETAHLEVLRRGSHVQELGSIQAGPEAAVNEALAPPADDSDKWYFTLILCGDDAPDKVKAQCKLLQADVTALKFKAWVKPEDPVNSWSHYQEIRIDDATQQDWLAPIKSQLEATGLPAVVVQPPRNGAFGANSSIVAIVGGYDGDPGHFSALIQERVKAYTDKHARNGTISAGTLRTVMRGHAQAEGPVIGGKPPFEVPRPVAYPPADVLVPVRPGPAPAVGMTFAEIRKAFPEIPAREALDYAKRGLTEEQIVEIENQLEVDSTPAHPTQPTDNAEPPWNLDGLAVIGFGLVSILGLFLWRNPGLIGRKSNGTSCNISGTSSTSSETSGSSTKDTPASSVGPSPLY